MNAIALGNSLAFKELFHRYSATVLGYSCRIVGSRELAEDISQDVWIKLVKSAGSFAGDSVRPWLLTITRNSALNQIRSQSRWQNVKIEIETQGDLLFSQTDIEALFQHHQNLDAAKAAIHTLPEAQRIALTLWMTEERSYEEISIDMDISVAAVKSLLARARETLKLHLGGRQ